MEPLYNLNPTSYTMLSITFTLHVICLNIPNYSSVVKCQTLRWPVPRSSQNFWSRLWTLACAHFENTAHTCDLQIWSKTKSTPRLFCAGKPSFPSAALSVASSTVPSTVSPVAPSVVPSVASPAAPRDLNRQMFACVFQQTCGNLSSLPVCSQRFSPSKNFATLNKAAILAVNEAPTESVSCSVGLFAGAYRLGNVSTWSRIGLRPYQAAWFKHKTLIRHSLNKTNGLKRFECVVACCCMHHSMQQ